MSARSKRCGMAITKLRSLFAKPGCLAAVLGVAVAAAGCDETTYGPRRTTLVHVGFQESCADELCGLTLDHGRAWRSDAFVAGERALSIAASSRVLLGVSMTTPSTWETVRFVARCDPGTSLRVEQQVYVWRATADGQNEYALSHTVQSEVVRPTGEWDLYNVQFPARRLSEFTQRVQLAIATEGPGDCAVDEIDYASLEASAPVAISR